MDPPPPPPQRGDLPPAPSLGFPPGNVPHAPPPVHPAAPQNNQIGAVPDNGNGAPGHIGDAAAGNVGGPPPNQMYMNGMYQPNLPYAPYGFPFPYGWPGNPFGGYYGPGYQGQQYHGQLHQDQYGPIRNNWRNQDQNGNNGRNNPPTPYSQPAQNGGGGGSATNGGAQFENAGDFILELKKIYKHDFKKHRVNIIIANSPEYERDYPEPSAGLGNDALKAPTEPEANGAHASAQLEDNVTTPPERPTRSVREVNEPKQATSSSQEVPANGLGESLEKKPTATPVRPASPKIPLEDRPVSPKIPPEDRTVSPNMPPEDRSVSPKMPPEDRSVSPNMPPEDRSVSPNMPPEDRSVSPNMPPEDRSVSPNMPPEDRSVSPNMPPEDRSVSPNMPPEDRSVSPEDPVDPAGSSEQKAAKTPKKPRRRSYHRHPSTRWSRSNDKKNPKTSVKRPRKSAVSAPPQSTSDASNGELDATPRKSRRRTKNKDPEIEEPSSSNSFAQPDNAEELSEQEDSDTEEDRLERKNESRATATPSGENQDDFFVDFQEFSYQDPDQPSTSGPIVYPAEDDPIHTAPRASYKKEKKSPKHPKDNKPSTSNINKKVSGEAQKRKDSDATEDDNLVHAKKKKDSQRDEDDNRMPVKHTASGSSAESEVSDDRQSHSPELDDAGSFTYSSRSHNASMDHDSMGIDGSPSDTESIEHVSLPPRAQSPEIKRKRAATPSNRGRSRGRNSDQPRKLTTQKEKRRSRGPAKKRGKRKNDDEQYCEDDEDDEEEVVGDEEMEDPYLYVVKELTDEEKVVGLAKRSEKSNDWFSMKLLIETVDNAGKEIKDELRKAGRVTREQYESVEKIVEDFKKAEYVKYAETEVNHDTKFPDDGDYRRCTTYWKKRILTTRKVPENAKVHKFDEKNPLKVPKLQLATTLYVPIESTSNTIEAIASRWIETRINEVFQQTATMSAPKPDETLHQEERADCDKDLEGMDKYSMSCPVFTPRSKEELDSPKTFKLAQKTPVFMVRKFGETLGIDRSKYDINVLAKQAPEHLVDIIVQSPQTSEGNTNNYDQKTWDCTNSKILERAMTLKDFVAYIQGQKQLGRRMYETLLKVPNNEKDTLKKTLENLMKTEIEVQEVLLPKNIDEKTILFDYSLYAIRFGTNINLLGPGFEPQRNELKKVPKFFAPFSKDDLLRHCTTRVLGVNTVQLYIKAIGSRTPAHLENSVMASINWNVGTGTCIWFSVPYEYWGKMEELIKRHQHEFPGQNFWPNEQELLKNGIPVTKFEQKPDDMVHVGVGSFHWVQSDGHCVNVSWNIGHPTFTQLAAAMVSHDHNILNGYVQNVPIPTMIVEIARKRLYMDDPDIYPLVRGELIRLIAHQKFYFDTLKKHGMVPIRAKTFPTQCKICGCSTFNIVKWTKLRCSPKFEEDATPTVEHELNVTSLELSQEEYDDVFEEIEQTEEEKKKEDYAYCGNCEIEEKDLKDRDIWFTYTWSLKQLMWYLDNYDINKPVPTFD